MTRPGGSGPRGTRGRVLLAVTLVGLVLAACSAPEPDGEEVPRVSPQDRSGFAVGVSMGDHLREASDRRLEDALDDVVRLRAGWIRIDVSWAALQPERGEPVRWSALDRIVREAERRRLRVLGIVGYTPEWARAPGCDSFACPPTDYPAFADFAASVVERYPRTTLRAIEVWNEPNLDLFWRTPDPVAYRNLLVTTLRAVRRVDARRTVLLGGTAPSSRPPDVDAAEFLRRACTGGACSDVDGIGYHPYSTPWLPTDRAGGAFGWTRTFSSVDGRPSLASVARQAGLAGKPWWFTEFGAPTAPDGTGVDSGDEASDRRLRPPVAVSEAQQARIVGAGIEQAKAQASDVSGIFVYTWSDLDRYGDTEDHYGLRRLDGTPKPAWEAFRRAAR